MTVADLIAALQKMPPHVPVRLEQDDIDDTEGLQIVSVQADVDTVLWEGNHVVIGAR